MKYLFLILFIVMLYAHAKPQYTEGMCFNCTQFDSYEEPCEESIIEKMKEYEKVVCTGFYRHNWYTEILWVGKDTYKISEHSLDNFAPKETWSRMPHTSLENYLEVQCNPARKCLPYEKSSYKRSKRE